MAFDYSKHDYNELVQEVTRLVQNQGEWQDAYQSSTGQVLIQLIAQMVDQLNYMLERRTQENFISTAQLQTSINALANLLGYRPQRKISASGTLSLQLTDVNGNPIVALDTVTMPKYTKITFDGNNYVNVEPIEIFAGSGVVTFDIKEGEVLSEVVDPTDTAGTLFNNNYVNIEDYLDIENDSFYIYTATQTFTDVAARIGDLPPIDTLGFADADDQVYDVNVTNEGLKLLFGDGVNGEKPTGNLTISYLKSLGTAVQVLTTNNDFIFDAFSTKITDNSANEYYYTLVNTTAIDGAVDAETTEDIRINAPAFVRTSNRAVTKEDYVYWVEEANIGGIVDSRAYGEEEIGVSVVNANNVYVVYLTEDGTELTSTELIALDNFLDAYKVVSTHLIYEPAQIIPMQLNVRIKRDTSLTASNAEVYTYVKTILDQYFAFDEDSLDREIYQSDIVNLLHDLTLTKSGVARPVAEHVNVDIYALYPFSTPWEATTEINAVINDAVDSSIYAVNINDIEYAYTATVPSDTVSLIAHEIYTLLYSNTSIEASVSTDTLTIQKNSRDVENELLHSEDVTNAVWTITGTGSQAAVAGLDGSNNAWNLTDSGAADTRKYSQSITVPITDDKRTISLWIEKDGDTANFPALELEFTGSSAVSTTVKINTSTGATHVAGATADVEVDTTYIDGDNNGWYRIGVSLANNKTNNTLVYSFYPAYTTTFTGDTPEVACQRTAKVFGMAVDPKATMGRYIKTSTKPISLTYESLPVENRFLWNEELDNAVWVKAGALSITPDQINDTDSVQTVDLLTFTAGGTESIKQTVSNVESGTNYTVSFLAQQGTTLTTAGFGVYDETNAAWIVDPVTTTYAIPATLSRVTQTFTVPSNCTSISVFLAQQESVAGTMYIGKTHLRKASSSTTIVPSHNHQIYHFDQNFAIWDGTSTGDVGITIPVEIPISQLDPDGIEEVVYPTSVEIIQPDGTVLYTDTPGLGSTGTINTTPAGTIDYTTGVMNIPLLTSGDYIVRYKQNADDNFLANERQAFSYSLPKTEFSDTVELLSTIELS
jgi:hypothetical protein